jgi:hypothetical protein
MLNVFCVGIFVKMEDCEAAWSFAQGCHVLGAGVNKPVAYFVASKSIIQLKDGELITVGRW